MRTTTWMAVAFMALGGYAPATRGNGTGWAARSPLVGSWHLIWLELPGPDGALRRITNAKGSLTYTPSGQVSVQVMYASASDTPSSGPVQHAQGGYEAPSGSTGSTRRRGR